MSSASSNTLRGDMRNNNRKGFGYPDVHFHASPKGCAGLVVPSIDDTTAHMFSFRSRLVRASGLPDIDGEFLFGSGKGKKLY